MIICETRYRDMKQEDQRKLREILHGWSYLEEKGQRVEHILVFWLSKDLSRHINKDGRQGCDHFKDAEIARR